MKTDPLKYVYGGLEAVSFAAGIFSEHHNSTGSSPKSNSSLSPKSGNKLSETIPDASAKTSEPIPDASVPTAESISDDLNHSDRANPIEHEVSGYDRIQNGKVVHVRSYTRGGKKDE